MSANFETFRKLHQAQDLFILPNAWDAKSAVVFAANNFSAVGTSSAAVASSLGYEDGEGMPFSDYLFVIKRILGVIKMPLTVDLEMGYGKSDAAIFDNIQQLVELGVAGINIEDSEIINTKRSLADANKFAITVAYIREKLTAKKLSLFINVRCDTYLINVQEKQKETIDRLGLYEKSGADGIFLPFIKDEHDIKEAVSHTTLPVNVMCIPGLPAFETLNRLGVKRASMGPFLFNKTYKKAAELAQQIAEQNNFSAII